jgi:glycine cleavage system transcriptional repressor
VRTEIVLTLTGPDRVGIVEEVTKELLDLGGNVQTSRMARLGGEFAILMLVAMPEERLGRVEDAFAHLTGQGYKLTTGRTDRGPEARPAGSLYRIKVAGADHEGIIHEIAHGLSKRGISIESAETETSSAPLSAAPLFSMTAVVAVPDEAGDEWRTEVREAGQQANVDVDVEQLDGL